MNRLTRAFLLLLCLPSSSLADAVLDQESAYSNAWFYCFEPINVWQQQVRTDAGGLLDSFEVSVVGPVGAQVELRLRVGDGWNVGPAVWSTLYTKTTAGWETPVFDVTGAGVVLDPGETFVLEAQGNDTGAELRGNYLHPSLGAPGYGEKLFLSGPGCYEDDGWRIGFKTWMQGAAAEAVRPGMPANPMALLPGQTEAPVIGAVWDPIVDHTAFVPAATADYLALSDGSGINVPSAFGTILCDLFSGPTVFTASPGDAFQVAIPDDCSLIGREFATQGISVGVGTIGLTNALDIRVGAQ